MADRLRDLRASPEFAEEKLVAEIQSLLQEKLEERGMNRADLARKMGVSRARVSQIFSDKQNFTVRMVAKAFYALGAEVCITDSQPKEYKSHDADNYQHIHQDMMALSQELSLHGDYGRQRVRRQGPFAHYPEGLVEWAAHVIAERSESSNDVFIVDERQTSEWAKTYGKKVVPLFGGREVANA